MKNGKVEMAKKEFVHEHEHLARVLRSGTKSQRATEARKQSRELCGIRSKR